MTFTQRYFYTVALFFLLFPAQLFSNPLSLLDDFEDGDSINNFENVWYYHDDNYGIRPGDRPQAGKGTTPSNINVPFTSINREAFGNKLDTFKIHQYHFTTKEEGSNKFATMPFTFGDTWSVIGCEKELPCPHPAVEMGALLDAQGYSIDLIGVDSITFKVRSHKDRLTVWFRFETKDIADDSTFAYYQKSVTTTPGAWKSCTIAIPADLAQPEWAKPDRVADIDLKLSQKLSWGVSMEDNPTVTNDTLDLDDVTIAGYTFVSPTVWTKTEQVPPGCGIFTTFDTKPKSATPMGTYWYAFTDADIGGTSAVTQGAKADPALGNHLQLDLETVGSGANNTFGAFLKGTIGKTIRQLTADDTFDTKGFLGIGFNTYDSVKSIYWNAATGNYDKLNFKAGANSIYFEYSCAGDFKYLTLEICDVNDVGDANDPTRKDSRGPGIVWYRNFLNTHGEWKKALIPFDSLITHKDWKGYKHIPLDKTKIAKIQWKTENSEGASGQIAVDNVYFPYEDFPVSYDSHSLNDNCPPASVTSALPSPRQPIAVRYLQHQIIVKCNAPIKTAGSFSLLTTQGAVVATLPVAFTGTISTTAIPTGMYIVQYKATLSNGKPFTEQVPVIIVQ